MILSGCTSEQKPAQSSSFTQTSTNVNVVIKNNNTSLLRAYTNSSDITAVNLSVIQNDTAAVLVQDKPFTQEGSNWNIALNAVPLTKELTFIAQGYDNTDALIYEGNTSVILQDNNNSVTITLVPLNSAERQLPAVNSITPYVNSETEAIEYTFTIVNKNRDDLAYELNVFNDEYANFNPAEGNLSFNGVDETSFMSYFEDLSSNVEFNASIKLINPDKGDEFTSLFSVTGKDDDINVTLHVAPNIESLKAIENADNTLSLEAVVTDSDTQNFSYNWEIVEGVGVNFTDNTANPAIISGYTGGQFIKVRVRVSDENGASSSVVYTINDVWESTVNIHDVFDDGSIVATYQFDGNANDLGQEYHSNSILYYTEGKFNQAITNSSLIPLGISLPTLTQYSISFFVNYHNITTNKSALVFKAGNETVHKQLYFRGMNGKGLGLMLYEFDYDLDSKITLGRDVYTEEAGILSAAIHGVAFENDIVSGWQHIVATFDGNTFNFYSDTILKGTIENVGSWNLEINSNNRWTTGNLGIDQVRIFNRALNQDDINTLYLEKR
jgi:hypothetical protein